MCPDHNRQYITEKLKIDQKKSFPIPGVEPGFAR
ncbi:unnamed protein product [Debaryomyces tyrocola]|nr:unnamed protein product [Debaryomyces tyrocola]